ncbi:hypothetical protein R6Q57_005341 [Mikania cordata]
MKTLLLSFPAFISKSTRDVTENAPSKLVFDPKSQFSCCSNTKKSKLRVISDKSKEGDFDSNGESDEFDSVDEFQLIPQSGDIEVGNSHVEKLEESVDDELTQLNLKNVTYNVVFVTSEASPYSKTGGLGDVCGSLPVALAARGHRVMVVSPSLLAAKYRPHGIYKDARSIILIHNLAHQGVEPATTYGNLGLPWEWYGALEWIFPTWARTHPLDTGQAVNVLKGAIVTVDRIVTVSQGYCWEITTPEGGFGLNELLSSRKFVLNGITNGIDVMEWDPSFDEHIPSHYNADDLSGKMECKIALQKKLGLPLRPDCPLIGFIGRLDYQKGIDIILSASPALLQDDVQFIMLGSGEKQYEEWMRATEAAFQYKFRGCVGFDVPISHQITAGCDILLMPSRYEPCGLNQLYAMRYGTIPVVHETGGLRETVKTYNPYAEESKSQGTGWAFSPLTRECMLDALRVAIKTYREHRTSWEGLMRRGMERECSWDNAAVQYEQVFEWALMDPPYIT